LNHTFTDQLNDMDRLVAYSLPRCWTLTIWAEHIIFKVIDL